MSLPTRDELPPDEKWDPSLVFESPAAWQTAADEFETRVEQVESYQGTLTEDAQTLREFLDIVEDLTVRQLGSLRLYAHLTSYVDTEDQAARDRLSRARQLGSRLDEALGFLEPELAANKERVTRWRESTDVLDAHDAHLRRLLAGASHTLPPEAESVLEALSQPLEAGSKINQDIAEGDFTPPILETPEGESVTITPQARTRYLKSRDRDFRKTVHTEYRKALRTHRHGMAAAYTQRIRADSQIAAIRDYDSALERRLDSRFPVTAYETVIDGVRGRLDPYHEYLDLRADLVDADLHEWDLHIPFLPDAPPEIPYSKAVDVICDAMAPLGDEYVTRLSELLSERRVDVRQTQNKRRGPKAILMASVDDGPFLALNYDGGLRSLYFFAHELGHAMHRVLASDTQRPIDQRIPDHVGEVASFVHEILLRDHLTEMWSDRRAVHAQTVFLDKLPTYRAARGATFIHELHQDVAAGADPGPDELDERHRELVSTFNAPVTLGEYAGAGWQEIDLARNPYHAYLYAVGSVGALSLTRSLDTGALSVSDYHEMLRRGRSVPPNEVFAPMLDFTAETTVSRGVQAYENYVRQLKDALNRVR